jgi:hypothetical protein
VLRKLKRQLPYYPQINGLRVSGKKLPWHNVVSHEVSWRNPKAIVKLLKPIYAKADRDYLQGNDRPGRCRVVHISGSASVPGGHDMYMVYRQD